jgi:hypothetical protein
VLKSSWNASNTKDCTNGKEPIRAPRIQRPNSGVRKLGRNDIDLFNPCWDQTTHFVNYIESPNVPNSSYNCKKTCTTSKAGPTMCVLFTNERKTQV